MNAISTDSSRRRCTKATWLAMLVPLALFILTTPPTSFAIVATYGIAAIIALPFTLVALLVFGIPAYMLLGRLGARNLLTLIAAGLVGGVGIWAAFSWWTGTMNWISFAYPAACGSLTALVFGIVNGVRLIEFDRAREN